MTVTDNGSIINSIMDDPNRLCGCLVPATPATPDQQFSCSNEQVISIPLHASWQDSLGKVIAPPLPSTDGRSLSTMNPADVCNFGNHLSCVGDVLYLVLARLCDIAVCVQWADTQTAVGALSVLHAFHSLCWR